MMNVVSFVVLVHTLLHNDGSRDGKWREQKKKKKKSPFFETFFQRFHQRLSEEWEGGACMWHFYDGDSPILLGERDLPWPKITVYLILLRDPFSWHMVTSLPPCVYYNFFFQDRCIHAVGSGGKWAVCKAFGNVRQFFILFFLSFWMGWAMFWGACAYEN
jgi:hypothetical protein